MSCIESFNSDVDNLIDDNIMSKLSLLVYHYNLSIKPTKCVGVGLYYLRGSSYRNYYKGLKKKFKIMFNDCDRG